MNGVYICDLDRFGYTLRVVGTNKEEVKTRMMDAYILAYADYNNGMDIGRMLAAIGSPVLDEDGEVDEYDLYNEFVRDYRTAVDECYTRFLKFGEVAWE